MKTNIYTYFTPEEVAHLIECHIQGILNVQHATGPRHCVLDELYSTILDGPDTTSACALLSEKMDIGAACATRSWQCFDFNYRSDMSVDEFLSMWDEG